NNGGVVRHVTVDLHSVVCGIRQPVLPLRVNPGKLMVPALESDCTCRTSFPEARAGRDGDDTRPTRNEQSQDDWSRGWQSGGKGNRCESSTRGRIADAPKAECDRGGFGDGRARVVNRGGRKRETRHLWRNGEGLDASDNFVPVIVNNTATERVPAQ